MTRNVADALDRIMNELRNRAEPGSKLGMARYGIRTDRALGGIPMPFLRTMAKKIGKNHELALALWSTGVHEARLLASLVDDPPKVTEAQMEDWVLDIDSWDLCDQCCSNLFSRTTMGWRKAEEWSGREEEFVKRAGFALMAALAVHDKGATDDRFLSFLGAIEKEASDPRNYVCKAVNWALRQIGKRNSALNLAASASAERIKNGGSKTEKWIATDALRELQSEVVQTRLERRKRVGNMLINDPDPS